MRGRRVNRRARLRRRLIVAAGAAVALCAAGGGVAWAYWQDGAHVSYQVSYSAPAVGYGVTSSLGSNPVTDCSGGTNYSASGSGVTAGCYLASGSDSVDLEINGFGDGYIPFETQAYSETGDRVTGTLNLGDLTKAGSLLAGSRWTLYAVPIDPSVVVTTYQGQVDADNDVLNACTAGGVQDLPVAASSETVSSYSGDYSMMPGVPAASAPEWKTFGWCLAVTGWVYDNSVTTTVGGATGPSVDWWTTVEQGPASNGTKSVIHVTADSTPYAGS